MLLGVSKNLQKDERVMARARKLVEVLGGRLVLGDDEDFEYLLSKPGGCGGVWRGLGC